MNPTKFAIQVEHSQINTRLDTKQNVMVSEHNSIIFQFTCKNSQNQIKPLNQEIRKVPYNT